MSVGLYLRSLLAFALLAPASTRSEPTVNLRIDIRSLWSLERLSSGAIETSADAADYARKAAAACGVSDPAVVPNALESRLATAEFEASKDSSKLVSDDHIAQAFNLMSDEFRVGDPTRLTGEGVSHYRSTLSAFWPHLFGSKSAKGSRPVGAVVTLYMLTFYGGMTGGFKKVGGPAGFGITDAEPDHPVPGTGKTSNLIALEYQRAAAKYFAEQSPEEIRSFLDRLAGTLALPAGGSK
jgi:hypothetical protein